MVAGANFYSGFFRCWLIAHFSSLQPHSLSRASHYPLASCKEEIVYYVELYCFLGAFVGIYLLNRCINIYANKPNIKCD